MSDLNVIAMSLQIQYYEGNQLVLSHKPDVKYHTT